MTTVSNTQNQTKNGAKQDLKKLLEDKELLKFPQLGEIVQGKVISVGKNEVRLDLDGILTGVVRGREMQDESGEFSNLKPGNAAEATVLELENENGEVELSFRYAGHKKAWDRLKELMEKQEMVDVDIIDANKGGLMIRIGKITGFMPVSQLSPEHYPRVPGGDKNKILEILNKYVNTKFKARVITAEEAEEKLIVSEKAAKEEEQKVKMSQFQVGDLVDCKITAITDFGVFVTFSDHMEGLIHISELAWQRIDDPKKLFSVGQKVKAEIISLDGSKIFLSIKKLEHDPWKNVKEKYHLGQIVKGKILKINPFGFFVELDPDIHGLAHISELSQKPIVDPKTLANIGDVLDFKIISIEPSDHRLGLSLKAFTEPKTRTTSSVPANDQKNNNQDISLSSEEATTQPSQPELQP
jgi:small subunit ribosomal protein S1